MESSDEIIVCYEGFLLRWFARFFRVSAPHCTFRMDVRRFGPVGRWILSDLRPGLVEFKRDNIIQTSKRGLIVSKQRGVFIGDPSPHLNPNLGRMSDR